MSEANAITHPQPSVLALPGGGPVLPMNLEQRRIRLRLTRRKPFPFLHGALVHGRYPDFEALPTPPAGLRVSSQGLRWVDMPVRGRPGAPGRAKGLTLGGVLGEVELFGLSREWLALLVAMEPCHAGSSPHYGFGRYVLPSLGTPDPFPPTSTLLAEALDSKTLLEALDRERPSLVDADLETLLPREPALGWIRSWLEAPVKLPGLGRIEGPVGNVEGPIGEWMDFRG